MTSQDFKWLTAVLPWVRHLADGEPDPVGVAATIMSSAYGGSLR